MKKILFFDNWTKGIHNFTPIAKSLEKLGWETLLVHRGSWEHDKNRPIEENINGLLCRDISYYKTKLVYNILKIEKPSCVLILTSNFIMDRAVIIAARSLSIKSIFLMHGVRSVTKGAIIHQKTFTNVSLNRKRWGKAKKYLSYTLPNYFFSGMKEDKLFLLKGKSLLLILKMFFNPSKHMMFPPISNELHCDLALVWDKAHKTLFEKEYGYPKNKIKMVGHPPLDYVFKFLRNPPKYNKQNTFFIEYPFLFDKKYCVYLETASVETGSVGWTEETRINHLQEIATICKNAGFELIIKLHPTTKKMHIKKYFSIVKKVRVISQINLTELIYWSKYAIGQTSTTNDIPIVMGKPLLIPAWGISESKSRIGLTKSVMSKICKTPEELIDCLSDNKIESINEEIKNNYFDSFITYTDGNSLNRTINAITSLVK
jgi:hypothetical protein